MVRPSHRREMAKRAVSERGACIRVACQAFAISESCFRYERKLDAENTEVANWLLRLTDNHRSWGFGLCYLYLRNVRGFQWNHKRVYRIYKELELNLRIKPRKRLVRDKPEALTEPEGINQRAKVRGSHKATNFSAPYYWADLYNGNTEITIDAGTVTISAPNFDPPQTYDLHFSYPIRPRSSGEANTSILRMPSSIKPDPVLKLSTCSK